MDINLPKYSKAIKVLSIIPVAVALMTFIEGFLPLKNIETVVTYKNESYRAKFDKTTYSLDFINNNDQFTKEIFDAFDVNDEVILYTTYFNEEVTKIKSKNSERVYVNATDEVYYSYAFSLVFLLAGLTWLKKRSLSAKQCRYALIVIIFSSISLIRILI